MFMFVSVFLFAVFQVLCLWGCCCNGFVGVCSYSLDSLPRRHPKFGQGGNPRVVGYRNLFGLRTSTVRVSVVCCFQKGTNRKTTFCVGGGSPQKVDTRLPQQRPKAGQSFPRGDCPQSPSPRVPTGAMEPVLKVPGRDRLLLKDGTWCDRR